MSDALERIEKLLDHLSPLPFDARHRAMREVRVPDSGVWLLNNPLFQQWVRDTTCSVLYCPGIGLTLFQT
jgi:hypothetical protein